MSNACPAWVTVLETLIPNHVWVLVRREAQRQSSETDSKDRTDPAPCVRASEGNIAIILTVESFLVIGEGAELVCGGTLGSEGPGARTLAVSPQLSVDSGPATQCDQGESCPLLSSVVAPAC